jgi:hypothetical protein
MVITVLSRRHRRGCRDLEPVLTISFYGDLTAHHLPPNSIGLKITDAPQVIAGRFNGSGFYASMRVNIMMLSAMARETMWPKMATRNQGALF